jgi:hypothetical protein
MRRFLLALTCASLIGAAAPASEATAKPCSAGWTHAALPWGHKCLKPGQFCKSYEDRAYHKYGFHCHSGRLK